MGENVQGNSERAMKRKLREMEARVRSSDVCLIGVSEKENGENGGEITFKEKVLIQSAGRFQEIRCQE